jgi:hypothetical protein
VYLPDASFDGLVDMTVELWVNTTDEGQAAILSGSPPVSGDYNELLLFQQSAPSDLMVNVKMQSSGRLPNPVNDGVWHHLAFTRQGATGRLYVDGAMVASRPYPEGPLDIGPGGMMLGQEQDCLGGCFQTGQAFDGLLDEVAVYGRALSEGEIQQIADAGGYGKCKPAPPLSDDGLVERVEYLESEVDSLNMRVADLEEQILDQELLMQRLSELEAQFVDHVLLMQRLADLEEMLAERHRPVRRRHRYGHHRD